MGKTLPDLARELEDRLERLGFELVEASWAGSAQRPILRIRMDLPDSVPGEGGVTVDQCAQVSRALEPWLDEHPEISERYTLEVSSPGVERPLVRLRDWVRFKGQPVRVKGRDLPGDRGNQVDGEIFEVAGSEEAEARVTLLLEGGETMEIPPMLSQPFIENSIEHGIKDLGRQGTIIVRMQLQDDRLILEIEEDGVGREMAQKLLQRRDGDHRSMATRLTRERIAAINRKRHDKIQMKIVALIGTEGNAEGTLVRFDIPV